jgi:hypothetical protein
MLSDKSLAKNEEDTSVMLKDEELPKDNDVMNDSWAVDNDVKT